jgi:hypothetical protein
MKVDMSPDAVGARLRTMDELWLLSVKLMNSKPLNGEETPPKRSQALAIQDSIRQVLYKNWDPLGINDYPAAADEYDAYIAPVYRILVGSRSEDELIRVLGRIEEKEMGVSAGSDENLHSVCTKLLELKVTLD